MFLGVQYHRPPFPRRKYWADDLSKIRDAGFHAVQFWALWGWIESTPGHYDYDDLDELMSLAAARGLKAVISTCAEAQPFWIHRKIPDSEMVNHLGHRVQSVTRVECQGGITPGGCTDNPRVAEAMGRFLTGIASHYAGRPELIGWDCWNEMRWTVHAEGRTCYCEHSIAAWRNWLRKKYGDLAGLNDAWQRRYESWQDVQPGRQVERAYSEMIEFNRWLTWRAAEHLKFRYERIRAGDPDALIVAHCADPSVQSQGREYLPGGNHEQSLSRGVDWDLADQVDGYGCSHFPFWGVGFDDEGFGIRVESSRSANRGKALWVSELQGGSARDGIMAHRSVEAVHQQRWVINGMARGAKAVIFWCWRDEVFGRESSGFGLNGWDGLAEERLAAMRETRKLIDTHHEEIEQYQPDALRVGILFTPENYLLEWAQTGLSREAAGAINGYARALERMQIPYLFVESNHLDVLDGLSVLLMPWSLVLPPHAAKAVEAFIKRGGRVLLEAETDAFDRVGLYRYPDERPFMQALGLRDCGRRFLPDGTVLTARLEGKEVELMPGKFITPLLVSAEDAQVLSEDATHGPLIARRQIGAGAAYVVGSFLGAVYQQRHHPGLEAFIAHVCADAGLTPDFEVTGDGGMEALQWRTGLSGGKRLLWVMNGGGDRTVVVQDRSGHLDGVAEVEEWRSGATIPVQDGTVNARIGAGTYAIFCWMKALH